MAMKKTRGARAGSPAGTADPQQHPALNNVRRLRQDRNWSQWQLAKISRLSERTIQRAEAGGRLGVTAEMALAAAFGIEVSDLNRYNASDLVDFTFLKRVISGNSLLDLVEAAVEASYDVDELKESEMKLVQDFIESLNLWVAVWKDKEPPERVTARQIFTSSIDELDSRGLSVFAGATAAARARNPQGPAVKVAVMRSRNPRIVQPKSLRQLGKEMSLLVVYSTDGGRSDPA